MKKAATRCRSFQESGEEESTQTGAGAQIVLALDQLNFVAVGVRHKSNHGAAAFDGACFAGHIAASGLDLLAGCIGIGHTQSNMTVSRTHVVALSAPVVGQLDLRLTRVAAFKAEKGQRVLVLGVLGRAQQLHADDVGVEVNRALEIANAQHRVEESHGHYFASRF